MALQVGRCRWVQVGVGRWRSGGRKQCSAGLRPCNTKSSPVINSGITAFFFSFNTWTLIAPVTYKISGVEGGDKKNKQKQKSQNNKTTLSTLDLVHPFRTGP